MSRPKEQSSPITENPKQTALEQFLQAVEGKTDDPIHKRLLKASRGENPTESLEKELGKIISEIIDEN